MAHRSIYEKFIQYPSGEIAADMPLSANKMAICTNNLQYLLDASGQQRINFQWILDSEYTENVNNADYELFQNYIIPWSYQNATRPFSPVIMIGGYAYTASTLYIAATFSIGASAIPGSYIDDIQRSICYWNDNTTETGTGTVVIDEIEDLSDNHMMKILPAMTPQYSVLDLDDNDDDLASISTFPEIRFTIWAKGRGFIQSVNLREYPL
jgi:hypothetical protein